MNSVDEEDNSEGGSKFEGDKGFQGLNSENIGTHKTLLVHKLYLDSCET